MDPVIQLFLRFIRLKLSEKEKLFEGSAERSRQQYDGNREQNQAGSHRPDQRTKGKKI